MRTSLRAMAAATSLAVAATTGVAAAVGARPAESTGGAAAAAPTWPVETTTEAPTTPALPEVTTADVDATVLEAARSAPDADPQSVVQMVQLTVIGGELELLTDHATVTLERVAGTSRDWTGVLPPVRVVDARGTLEGWTVRWRVEDVSVGSAARRVRVAPDAPVVVAGSADGLVAGSAGPSGPRGRTLFRAHVGYGGGTYEAGGTVTLRLPPHVDVDEVVVDLAFALD